LRQIANTVDDSQNFDSICVRLIEDEPSFMSQIEPTIGCVRVSLAPKFLGGMLCDAVANLLVDSFNRGGPAIDERNEDRMSSRSDSATAVQATPAI
jgi:hypothetical protein